MSEVQALQAILDQLEIMAETNFGLELVQMLALGWIADHQR